MLLFAQILLGMLPNIFAGLSGVSDNIKNIIKDVTGGLGVVLGSGVLTQPSVNSALAAWLGVITLLKQDPNLPVETLNRIVQVEKMVQAAITQDAEAAKLVDWNSLSVASITPLP